MGRLIRTLMFLALIFVARPAFAGGACPSGANYTNPTNPNGALVTLASLGITNCYFIAASGSDSNSGTSETSPWLHSAGMQNCSSNCASVTLAAGVGIIFRGGDTWHFGNPSASPYAGVVSGCAANGTVPAGLCLNDINVTSLHPVYYGVDQTWFTGGSWARPILTADNSPCYASTVGTLPDGATCTGTTDTFGQPSYYVSSCPYQIGSSNNLVDVGFSEYVIFDNFEMLGHCLSHVGEPSGDDVYVRYGAANGPLYFLNLYIHGASHLQFAGPVASAACTASTVCLNTGAFTGSVTNGSVGETIAYNVLDFSDSDPAGQGVCNGGLYNVAYNVFRYVVGCLPGTLHTFHDNLYEDFFEDGHSNLIESNDVGSTNAIYNNVFRHIEQFITGGGGGVGLWFGPASGSTDYIFNNVMYDVGQLEYLNIGGTGLTTIYGNYAFFNNTFQSNGSQPILRCASYTNGTVTDTNNQYIDDQTYILGPCSTLTSTTAKLMTNATATSDGYTSSQTYAYSPTSSSSPTVSQGTNVLSSLCGALTTAAMSDSLLSDAATACASDTRYGVVYNSTSHTVSYPGRTVMARSASIGAYESNGTSSSAPNAPTNLSAIVN